MMQYLTDDPRLLFTVLLLSATAVLLFLFSMIHRIIAKIKARQEAAAQAPPRDEPAFPQACRSGGSAPCCAAGAGNCK